MPGRRKLGAFGELVAASWLRSQGMKVLRQNFRWGRIGELDLVCRDGDTLVFTEVKSLSTERYGAPGQHVDARKRRRLRCGALNWLRLLGQRVPIRFDIVEVTLRGGERPQIQLHRAAFTLREGAVSRSGEAR